MQRLVIAACFVGASAIVDYSAWPAAIGDQTQPKTLALWPLTAAALPQACTLVGDRKTSILKDNATGWPGQCKDLTVVTPASGALAYTKETCQQACMADATCSVWQFSQDGCYTGQGHDCVDRGGDTLLQISGAQRVQRGDVTVLKNMSTVYVFGLQTVGTFGSGTAAENMNRCRGWCYSNIYCQFWQFSAGVCSVESKSSPVTWPLTAVETFTGSSGASVSTAVAGDGNPARALQGGEYIQHSCPVATTPAPLAKSAAWDPAWGIATLAILCIGAAALACFCYGSGGKAKGGSRAVKKTRAVKATPKAELVMVEPESVPLVPLMAPASTPFMQYPAPVMQYAAAPMQYAAAPMQYAAAPTYQPVQQFQTYMQ